MKIKNILIALSLVALCYGGDNNQNFFNIIRSVRLLYIKSQRSGLTPEETDKLNEYTNQILDSGQDPKKVLTSRLLSRRDADHHLDEGQ